MSQRKTRSYRELLERLRDDDRRDRDPIALADILCGPGLRRRLRGLAGRSEGREEQEGEGRRG